MNTSGGDGYLNVDRGPNWLFVNVVPAETDADLATLADDLWLVVSRHFTYRVVLEMDAFDKLSDVVIKQLQELRDRLEGQGGALRVCGLKQTCARKLDQRATESGLRSHSCREDAVWGIDDAHRTTQAPHSKPQDSSSDSVDEVALTR